ncbi:MAG: hypothetical protein EBY20_02255 [Alphaproteobacteria bacterium]|uniref:Uncharacterized protein n=1 Tax=viral metagenome TaxID=1070528 RepID=A0A6C0HR59_9ZZZZ|nr:hypothetical protein [Alphaproteobacteria bacterium]
MDVENPLHEDDIPLAKLVCLEVMGQPMEETELELELELEPETSIVNIQVSCNKVIYNVFSCCCTCLVFMVCFGGFFIFITGFPFAYS